MRLRLRLRLTVVAAAIVLATGHAHAGQICTPEPMGAPAVKSSLILAQATHNALNATDAQVVILARMGQDLSKYGVKYSHLGIAFRKQDKDGQSFWHVVHKLNGCGTASSDIFVQGLAEFFMDDLWRYEAAWVVPTAAIQQQLVSAHKEGSWPLKMHQPAYSMVSYAWGQKYQQSNQWALETMAAAISSDGIETRDQAQSWLKLRKYKPSTLQIGAMTRLGGRVGRANIAFDDHPNERRFSDQIDTVTVDSVFDWMTSNGLAQKTIFSVR